MNARRLTLERRLVIFDLETTGLDFQRDRVIEIAGEIWTPEVNDKESFSFLVNPGIPIPAEITELTGISNSDVVMAPKFEAIAGRLLELFGDGDIGGWNVIKFDGGMLAAEFKRAGHDFRLADRNIVDARVIWTNKEPQNLAAAAKFYCGIQDAENSHRAGWDVNATARILEAQLDRYQDLPLTVAELAKCARPQYPTWVDSQGKIVWRDGEASFSFGKYSGYTMKAVMNTKDGPGYMQWLVAPERGFAPDFTELCRRAIAGTFPKKA